MFDGKRGWRAGGWRRLGSEQEEDIGLERETSKANGGERETERERGRGRERETGFRFGVSRGERHGISREADHEWTRLPQLCR